nr:hypothetical protein Itr_chr05CG15920 [Ipomoea trifida]
MRTRSTAVVVDVWHRNFRCFPLRSPATMKNGSKLEDGVTWHRRLAGRVAAGRWRKRWLSDETMRRRIYHSLFFSGRREHGFVGGGRATVAATTAIDMALQ